MNVCKASKIAVIVYYDQCPDEIVPHKSTSTTLRNTPLTYKHDSAGSFSITGNQLNRVYVRARDYAKLYWSTCSVLFRPDTDYDTYKFIRKPLKHARRASASLKALINVYHTLFFIIPALQSENNLCH
jgi:hypothetical protein